MESILYNLILYYSNILIGTGIAFVLTLIVTGLVILFFKSKQASVFTYLLAIVTLPFIAFQLSRIYGAVELSSTIDAFTSTADVITSSVEDNILNNDDVMQATSLLSEFIPGVSDISDGLRSMIASGKDVVVQAHDYIQNYIIRRVLWTMLFIVISIAGMSLTMSNADTTTSLHTRRAVYGQRERHTQGTGRRHRY